MKIIAFVAMSTLIFAAGCDKKDAGMNPPAADNTKVNERDRNKTVTPLDQGNGSAELETTQKIRQALMADDTLSQDAKNAKVITNAGVVTLRGPVKSDAEKAAIDAIARRYAGTNRVDNQLDVKMVEGQSP